MTKKVTIFVSALLIISAVLIGVLLNGSKTELDKELVVFFKGILYGAGFALLIKSFFEKKKQ